MKKIMLLIAATFLAMIVLAQEKRIGVAAFSVVNTSTTVPIRLVTTNLFVTKATVLGMSGARTNNTGTVYIGFLATDNTQPFPVLPGGETTINAGENKQVNLFDYFFDVTTANDGLTILYQ